MSHLSSSPVVYLARRAWEHAAGHRRWMLLYVSMFLAAQSFGFVQPYVIGRLLNAVQTQLVTPNLGREIYTCALMYFLIELAFWTFHGPARVLERYVAFQIRASY